MAQRARAQARRGGQAVGEELRRHKAALGRLVTLEVGKLASEGLGEVQEMIDICDFAVGLSRQLYGLTIPASGAGTGPGAVASPGRGGVITAFNFPVAVWAWNAAIALVCGDTVVWKPSRRRRSRALATQARSARAARVRRDAPEGLLSLPIGGANRRA